MRDGADEVAPLLLQLRLALQRLPQPCAHRFKGGGDLGHLAHPRGRQLEIEIAGGDLARGLAYCGQRTQHGASHEEATITGIENCTQAASR